MRSSINHTQKWNVSASPLNVLLKSMGSIASYHNEIDVCFNKVLWHLVERWSTVFAFTENGTGSTWYLWIELHNSMDMILISNCSVHTRSFAHNTLKKLDSGFRAKTSQKSACIFFFCNLWRHEPCLEIQDSIRMFWYFSVHYWKNLNKILLWLCLNN